jgi:hypothetical protein
MSNIALVRQIEQTDMALEVDRHTERALLKPRNGFWLDAVYPQTSGSYQISHYRVEGKPTLEAVKERHSQLLSLMTPATDQELLMELNRLWVLTSHKSKSAPEFDITLEAYTEKLKSYPRDAVVEALHEAPDHSQWWPTWKELKTEIEKKCSRRVMALEALERKIDGFDENGLDRYRRVQPRRIAGRRGENHLDAPSDDDD